MAAKLPLTNKRNIQIRKQDYSHNSQEKTEQNRFSEMQSLINKGKVSIIITTVIRAYFKSFSPSSTPSHIQSLAFVRGFPKNTASRKCMFTTIRL